MLHNEAQEPSDLINMYKILIPNYVMMAYNIFYTRKLK